MPFVKRYGFPDLDQVLLLRLWESPAGVANLLRVSKIESHVVLYHESERGSNRPANTSFIAEGCMVPNLLAGRTTVEPVANCSIRVTPGAPHKPPIAAQVILPSMEYSSCWDSRTRNARWVVERINLNTINGPGDRNKVPCCRRCVFSISARMQVMGYFWLEFCGVYEAWLGASRLARVAFACLLRCVPCCPLPVRILNRVYT